MAHVTHHTQSQVPDVETDTVEKGRTVTVWGPLTRLFHWGLAGAYVVAWLTAEEIESVHFVAGYTVASLVALRLPVGLVGPRRHRFSSFVRGPRPVLDYLKGLLSGKAPRHLGHNPAGAAMILALLLSLACLTATGMTLAGIEGEGPLAGTAVAMIDEDPVEEVHEFFANFTLFLVLLHIGGVALSSRAHGENLARSMITGKKRVDGADTGPEPR